VADPKITTRKAAMDEGRAAARHAPDGADPETVADAVFNRLRDAKVVGHLAELAADVAMAGIRARELPGGSRRR
jgi:hypothetical protein